MKVLFALIVGAAIGVGAVFYYSNRNREGSTARDAADKIENAAKSTRDAVQDKIKVLDLKPEDIKADLEKTGQVVRRKAKEAGQAISDATVDARTTAAIKSKFLGSKELSVFSVAVNTTDGVVTLSGTVNSVEDISKAMTLAMEPEGVREVVSTLQVKPKPAKP